ncbi:MAG: hypothetical protein ACFB0C_09455 [Leptolyngbyaceae cyanobacterium]
MPDQQYLKIKFHKALGIFELICSSFILCVSFLIGFSLNTITGLVLFGVSIRTLTSPMVVITPADIQMRNLLGMTLKRHPYSPEQVSVRNHLVYINEKRIFSTFFYDVSPKQVKAFFAQTSLGD